MTTRPRKVCNTCGKSHHMRGDICYFCRLDQVAIRRDAKRQQVSQERLVWTIQGIILVCVILYFLGSVVCR